MRGAAQHPDTDWFGHLPVAQRSRHSVGEQYLDGRACPRHARCDVDGAADVVAGEVDRRTGVDTDMQRGYRAAAAQAGAPITTPQLSPEESARALVTYIETLGPEKAGRFYSYNGQEVPW